MDLGTATPTAPDTDSAADTLRDSLVAAVDSDYEIVRLIGRGGMGAVYLARDRALERLVAIKVLPPGTATDTALVERFRREAKTVASLQHPGIVPLYAFGERRGLCWFVMGYVRGESLSATSLTQVGSVLGTPHYMSPEQASAEPTLDGRSDLYSVGVAGYQMLSGKLPFDGTNFRALVLQHLSVTPAPLSTVAPDVPRDLADAVMQCLEKDPAKRFADGRSLRAAIGGGTYDDESIGYELSDLKHGAAWIAMILLLAATFTISALVGGGKFLGQRAWFHAASPLFFFLYAFRVRQAKQRGYEWGAIKRAMTMPPKWWFLWWPAKWRTPTDVFKRLPSRLKTARVMPNLTMLLCLAEIPLIAFADHRLASDLRDRLPALHALSPIRWVGSFTLINMLLLVIGFLLMLIGSMLIGQLMTRRIGKQHGLGALDRYRLVYAPTDSQFWRDPRIQPIVRGLKSERRPTSPQEFVSQILAGTGTLTPFTSSASTATGAAARRLLDAITALDKEIAQLEKAAPREQLDRIDAEIIALEADGADDESITLLMQQRDAVVRSRERIQRLAARRDDAAGRIETLWIELRKLSAAPDAATAKSLAEQLSERCDAALVDFPVRTRTTTSAQRTVTAGLLLLAVSSGALAAVRAPSQPALEALAMVQRGQPGSALTLLAWSGSG
jgi:hypothetical protein